MIVTLGVGVWVGVTVGVGVWVGVTPTPTLTSTLFITNTPTPTLTTSPTPTPTQSLGLTPYYTFTFVSGNVYPATSQSSPVTVRITNHMSDIMYIYLTADSTYATSGTNAANSTSTLGNMSLSFPINGINQIDYSSGYLTLNDTDYVDVTITKTSSTGGCETYLSYALGDPNGSKITLNYT